MLTGIQSTGIPHLGNILGAMRPALRIAQETKPSFFFIADLHTITVLHDPTSRKHLTYAVAAAWLASGLNPEHHIFYRQSRVPAVCELAWYLSSVTPYPMLANAHAFKAKSQQLSKVNTALFTYPILMAADILLYDATHVPVGQDQQQHIEMARDIAQAMNRQYDQTLFTLPTASISKVPTLLGTDGRKMSKSYKNTINIFAPEKELRKAIMNIQTDSKPLEAPKDPSTCLVFQLYHHLASPEESAVMASQYRAGGYGYGQAKKELFTFILTHFAQERKAFNSYMEHPDRLETILQAGEAKARALAETKMNWVRKKLGYN